MRNRRWLLALFPALATAKLRNPFRESEECRSPQVVAPTDAALWTSFATCCNSYTDLLKAGILDAKAWGRVESAWQRLTHA